MLNNTTEIDSCPICLEKFDHEEFIPKLFSCSHNICALCEDARVIVDGKIQCPRCQQWTFSPLPQSYVVVRESHETPEISPTSPLIELSKRFEYSAIKAAIEEGGNEILGE